jgi:hypothetical protein
LMGQYKEIHYYNKNQNNAYDHRIFSFVRWSDNEQLIIISNFDAENRYDLDLRLPEEIVEAWQLEDGVYSLEDQLLDASRNTLSVENGQGKIKIQLGPLASNIYKLQKK